MVNIDPQRKNHIRVIIPIDVRYGVEIYPDDTRDCLFHHVYMCFRRRSLKPRCTAPDPGDINPQTKRTLRLTMGAYNRLISRGIKGAHMDNSVSPLESLDPIGEISLVDEIRSVLDAIESIGRSPFNLGFNLSEERWWWKR